MIKTIWKDPVWGSVIAAGIVASVAAVGTFFSGWWPAIWQFVERLFAFTLKMTTIPNWMIGLFALLAIPTLIFFLALGWEAIRPASVTGPSWRSYMVDTFFGLRWRWKYFDNGQIWDVHTFCPHCDFQVFPENASAWDAIDRIRFRCDSCHTDIGEFQESFESLENKTKRFVQQKIRNGSWHGSTDEPTATRQESP